jgi:hypothetical protein
MDWDEGGWAANAQGNTYGLDFATTNTNIWVNAPVKSDYFWSLNGPQSFIVGALGQPYYLFFGAQSGGGADMSFALRIGEKIERFYKALNNSWFHPLTDLPPNTPTVCGHSRITYEPTLGSAYADYKDGIYEESNATLVSDGVQLSNGYVTWAIRSPYVIYSSEVTVTGGSFTRQVSYDLGKTWTNYSNATQAQQRYDYLLKVSGTGKITGLKVVTIGQLNPGCLPTLRQGLNKCRLYLYDNNETLTLLPNWKTSGDFNRHVVSTSGFTYRGTANFRNGGETNSGSGQPYITLELTGPQSGKVQTASGYFTSNRAMRQRNYQSRSDNTYEIRTGNSQSNLQSTTTVPAHTHTTPSTMSSMVSSDYGFAHWGHSLAFERDAIQSPGNRGYVQCRGVNCQTTSIRECELYMHYYVNHLSQDYLNDIKITHIYNQNSTTQGTVEKTITAEQIASGNGVVDYDVLYPLALPMDPSHAVIMEVEPGVTLSSLQNNPVANGVDRDGQQYAFNSEMSIRAMPNPFHTSVSINFSIAESQDFRIERIAIYNVNGRVVKEIQNSEILKSKNPEIRWDASNHPSGVYIVKAVAGNATLTKRITLIR